MMASLLYNFDVHEPQRLLSISFQTGRLTVSCLGLLLLSPQAGTEG
jgi:hypothetical protein